MFDILIAFIDCPYWLFQNIFVSLGLIYPPAGFCLYSNSKLAAMKKSNSRSFESGKDEEMPALSGKLDEQRGEVAHLNASPNRMPLFWKIPAKVKEYTRNIASLSLSSPAPRVQVQSWSEGKKSLGESDSLLGSSDDLMAIEK